jgi:hypothetical protein
MMNLLEKKLNNKQMKNYISIILMIVCFKSYGQTQADKDLNGVIHDVPFFSNISSDWRNSTSNKINKFDWTSSSTFNRTFSSFNNPTTIAGTNYYGADPVELPFYRTTGPNVNNPNLLTYAINPFIPQNLDIHPEDGWEILTMDFGGRMVAIGQMAIGNEVKLFPNFVIYNRYTSKLRVYYLIPQIENFNGAFISATFPTDGLGRPKDDNPDFKKSIRTALFSFAYPITNHLEEWNNKAYLTATNNYQANKDILQWIYGEFDVAYDPCTCLLKNMNKNVKIYFQLYTTALSKIDLKGESTTIHNIADNSSAGGGNSSVPKTSFMDDVKGIAGAGQQYYNEWSGYEKSANDILDKGYDLWSKKLEKDFFKYYTGGINDPKTGKPLNNLSDLKSSGIWNEWLKVEKTNDPKLNFLKDLKNVASFVPYVGAAIGVMDYLVNGAKKSEQTIAAPSISQTKYSFTGSLTYTSSPITTILNLPGARNQNFVTINNTNNSNGRLENGTYLESTDNAIYNQTLGVFNLLGPPKFESIDYEKQIRYRDLNDRNIYASVTNNDLSYKPINWFAIQQCKINEIPKYVVNPAADVEVVSIDAAIVLEFESNSDGYNLFMDKYSDWSKFPTIPFHKDYWKNGSAITLEDRINSIEESGLELDYVSDAYPNTPNSVIRFRTAYVPYNCLTMPNFTVFNWNKGMKVYLKLMVRLQRKHAGSSASFSNYRIENEKIPLNMVLTYDVTKAYNERINNTWTEKGIIKIAQTPWEIYNYRDGVSIKREEFDGSNPSLTVSVKDWRAFTVNVIKTAYSNPFIPGGNQTYLSGTNNIFTIGNITIPRGSVIPKNSLIRSGENIIIEDDVLIGDNSEIIAGKEIIVNTENEINPKVTLKLESGIWLNDECKNSDINSLRGTDEEILSLCNSKKYKEKSGLDKTNLLDQIPSQFTAIYNQNFEMSIYPNPTVNGTQLIFNIVNPTNIEINLYDLSGNKISTIVCNNFVEFGNHIEYIDTQNLTSGLYLVTLSTSDGYSETKKLIIAK